MKKTIFMTGATGHMGWSGFKELYARRDRFIIKILARDSEKNRKKLSPYISDPSVKIVWGDLMNYKDVLEGVKGADIVLHMGGMVSPIAEYFPDKTLKVNVLSSRYIAKAVLEQPNSDDIKVVYVGSVAQYGDRMPPYHWGRAGDPVLASKYDCYSISKCLAEKEIVDSGIAKWVSIRQTSILYSGLLQLINPVTFHVPMSGVLEWVTIEDSGRAIANICEDSVPDKFWNNFYNLSSGPQYRMTNYEFISKMFEVLRLPSVEKVFEPQWFAMRNFHGMWYQDGDVLEEYLHFRDNIPIDEYFKRLKQALPWYYSFAFLAPAPVVKIFMKRYAYEKGLGTQSWLKDSEERINAFYGSRAQYDMIKSWDDICPNLLSKSDTSSEIIRLDHGWNERADIQSVTDEELTQIASYRGGKYIRRIDERFCEWECENEHRFTASLEYVLLGGGWCTECKLDNLQTETEKNKFVSQIKLR